MASTTVYPGCPDPTHDISLTDGVSTYGFIYAGGPRVLQEIPLSPPAQTFAVEQTDWTGGRGNLRYTDDQTGFNDSSFLWSTTHGQIFPSPQWRFGTRADADTHLHGNASTGRWKSLYGTSRFIDRYFTAASSGVAADKAYLYIRRVGTPGTLTLEYCIDSGLSLPSTMQKMVMKTVSDITDTTSTYCVFDWTGTTTRTAGAVYHLKLYGASTDTLANHWEVFCDYSTSGLISSNGSVWTSTAEYGMYFRVTGADTKRQWKFFEMETGLYAVSINDDRSNSVLLMNGVRATASSGTATTVVAAIAGVTANQYAGATLHIYDGKGDGIYTLITANTATTAGNVTFTVTAMEYAPDATSKFVVYSTDQWPAATGTPGLGYVTNKPIVAGGIAYFPQGNSVAIRRMRVNGSSHDYASEATAKADMLYLNVDPKNGNKVYGANAVTSTCALADIVAWGTDLAPGSAFTVGTTTYRITNIYNHNGILYVFKEDGLYQYDGTRVTRIGNNFKDVTDRNNGVAVGSDDKYMWWSWAHSIVRSLSDQHTDMMNFRLGYEGMPDNRRGQIVSAVSALGWMFFVVDGGASNYSSIIVWNGYGWHEIYRGWATGVRIRNAYWQACPGAKPRLWFDVNGDIAFMEFPQYSANPRKDSTMNYHHEGVLVTSTIDINQPTAYKVVRGIKALLETSTGVLIDYQINDNVGGAWTPLGAVSALYEEITANLGEVLVIRFRFRIPSYNSRSPSVISSWSLDGRMMPRKQYQYIGTFTASASDSEDKIGNQDDSPDAKYAALIAWAQTQEVLTMRSLLVSSDNKRVTVSLPAKSADYVDDEDWGGYISFAMLEV